MYIHGRAKKGAITILLVAFSKTNRFSYKFIFCLWNEPKISYYSKFVFKLSSDSLNSQMNSLTPFADCFINYALIKFFRDFKMRPRRSSTFPT